MIDEAVFDEGEYGSPESAAESAASPATPERNRIAQQQQLNFLHEAPSNAECERGSALCVSCVREWDLQRQRLALQTCDALDLTVASSMRSAEPVGLPNGPATRTGFRQFFSFRCIQIIPGSFWIIVTIF